MAVHQAQSYNQAAAAACHGNRQVYARTSLSQGEMQSSDVQRIDAVIMRRAAVTITRSGRVAAGASIMR